MTYAYAAVPRLTSPEIIPGAGGDIDAEDWAARIDTLRPRFLALSPRVRCNLCREAYFADLLFPVVSTPYSAAMLECLRSSITEACWKILHEDSQRYGNSLLGADLAASVFQHLDALLTAAEARRATPEQFAELSKLVDQMSALDDTQLKFCLNNLESIYLPWIIQHSGGLGGVLARRLQGIFSAKAWAFVSNDYPEAITEPLDKDEVAQALLGLPELPAGKPWPVCQLLSFLCCYSVRSDFT